MGLPEPNNELYAAVKSIFDPWPPDDEETARQLGQTWRSAGQAASQAKTQVESSQQAVTSAWRDEAGSAFGAKLDSGGQSLQQISEGAAQLAAAAEKYAQELVDAKTTITQVVSQNLATYLQLGSPMFGPEGALLQQQMAMKIAAQLRAMIEAKAAALGTAVPAPAPAPPAKANNDQTVLGLIGDGAGVVSAIAGFAALFPLATGIAAPIAAAAGGIAFGAHAADALINKPDDPMAWYSAGNDLLGFIPAVKAANAAYHGVTKAATAVDGLSSAWNVVLQGPAVAAPSVDDPRAEVAKDTASLEQFIPNGISLVRAFR